MSKPRTDSYASVWDAIADTPEDAANLRVRSELMDKITAVIDIRPTKPTPYDSTRSVSLGSTLRHVGALS